VVSQSIVTPERLQSTAALKQTMDGYYQRLLEASQTGRQRVAWCTSVGPAELLYSLGFAVYFPENHAAILGASKTADRYIPRAVAAGYSAEVCSYLTSDVGALLCDETPLSARGFRGVPRPDVLVYNTNQCHEVQDWFELYGRRFGAPVLGVHTPLGLEEVDEATVEYVAGQLRGLVQPLERVARRGFDPEAFAQAVGRSREASVLWRRVLETARSRPAPLTFFDASVHMGPIVVMRGTQPAIDYYAGLLAELEGRVSAGVAAVPGELRRVYWDGMPIWFKLSALSRFFAERRTSVVASTYCNSWVFDPLDPARPFESSARAYCELFIARSERFKLGALQKMAADFAVDGVLFHDARTCARNSNGRFALPGRLREVTGLPTLEIQGDMNDARCYSEEQSKMAIETFLDQLGAR
jgi:benzoyl-CoA reductase/2-hydroxyglutaryl-CoA dehydratase subunit BcrC/BadD/HgdB